MMRAQSAVRRAVAEGEQSMKKSSAHILVVDDQALVRADLRDGLEEAGFGVSEAEDLAGILARLEQEPPISLITLDLTLAHEDGLDLAREIRARRNIPVIMITARAAPFERVAGLEHGADDYIAKPFDMREVVLRVRMVLRRYGIERDPVANGKAVEAEASEAYTCEVGDVDVRRREVVTHGGAPLQLTDAEFDIFVTFLRNPARVMSRDELSGLLKGRVWMPPDRTLDGLVARLRKKIEVNPSDPHLIKTVWRVGYVFTGDVRRQL
jgi:DNA-binding response OmpR family regulator